MTVLRLLGKPDCHLCHEMEGVVRSVLAGSSARLELHDVRDDPEAWNLYRFEIPLLFLGETEIARHRIGVEELRRRLEDFGIR